MPVSVSPSAVSPFVTEYTAETPYITVAEFLAAPTALEISDLIPGGTQAQQTRALQETIAKASSWADSIVKQVLACTVDVERGRYRVDRYGYVNVPLKYNPVLEVTSVNVGTRPSKMHPLLDFSDLEMHRYSIRVPVWSLNLPFSIQGSPSLGSRVLVDVTYVNGWVNALTSAATVYGATTLPLTSVLGVFPGSSLTVSDGLSTETVTVAANYGAGTSPVLLAAPLAYAHAAGVSVNNMPSRVKEAVIALTTVLIQTRGNDAIILDAMDTPQRMSGAMGSSEEGMALAMDLLESLERVK